MSASNRFGPRLAKNGVTFRLWAPAASSVQVRLEDRVIPATADAQGWHSVHVPGAGPGTRYGFAIGGTLDVPDPASHFQPDDVGGLGEVIDHAAFAWQATRWHGRPWRDAAILELHVGTFSPEGTYLGAIERLDHVAATGFTAIELLPLADFPGRRNWGYDGVLLFAPDSRYGRPEDLKALIDAAHMRGLMVFLDVVYNHFGPEGNYLGRYAPEFFTPDTHTPWGAAIDYRVPMVRRFAIENALHWLDAYRFDGLRLDAVHAITTRGTPSILDDLSAAVGELAAAQGRHVHLILENDGNEARLLDPLADPPRGRYRAQWNDDYHHVWHVMLSGETNGYYHDYAASPRTQLARILSSGFAYQGDISACRGDTRGEPSDSLPPAAFVSFLQNHDQIGNRARGERLDSLAPATAIEAALAITLLAPMPPLMFMGEEWGSRQPFPFFCDFEGELAEAVRSGRREEFKAAYAHEDQSESVPDPLEESTFRSAILDWADRERGRERLALVTRLLHLRRDEIAPNLDAARPHGATAELRGDVLIAEFRMDARTLALTANLSETPAARPSGKASTRAIWGGPPPPELPPWSVYWGCRYMPPAVPRATYRLQLHSGFGFAEAASLVPYLKALGISHVYASPFLQARKGSTHGYDITDHARLNAEFGGEEGFQLMSDALAGADIGLILDFVPNHMGVGYADNAWWLDVLEWGPRSPHADAFDIDWHGLPNRRGRGLLLPILGKPYSDALESGDIELRYDDVEGSFSAWYFGHRLPIRPQRYTEVIKTIVFAAGAETEPAGRALLDLAQHHASLNAPSRGEAPALKAALAAIADASGIIARGIGAYRSIALHRLLERQWYRLAHWRVAVSDINYRRFFDVNDLAGLRVEEWDTFRAVHRLVASLIHDGRLHGLRLDHIDGLADPVQYCRRLQRLARGSRPRRGRTPFYVVAEKILADGESTPPLPGVAGLTGYEAMNDIARVLLKQSGMDTLDAAWRDLTDARDNFQTILHAAKRQVIASIMASEFIVLVRLLARIAAGHFPSRDFTFDRLRAALELYVIHFPIYRTYIAGDAVSDADRATIQGTIAKARSEWTGPDGAIFDFIRAALTLDLIAPGQIGYAKPRVRAFALKMQQFTGPVMAKSLEDTAFYRYHRLLALNEVGGDPSLPGLSIPQFHDRMRWRAARMPHGLTATSTHDTKRGEDARMRILALAELAPEWTAAAGEWARMHAHVVAPTRAHRYMLYQTLIGVWPGRASLGGLTQRLQAYAIKAAREGKQNTSWINPNEDYERALSDFVRGLLTSQDFLASFEPLAERAALLGALNSLAQLTLKATIPGVPDFYQGTETWDLSLVDPDNRRPVDFEARRGMLAEELEPTEITADPARWVDGRVKFGLSRRLLALRRALPDLFAYGGYEPLDVADPESGSLIAYARTRGRDAIIVAVPRYFATLTNGGRHWPREAWRPSLSLDGYRDIAPAWPGADDTKMPIGVWRATVIDPARRHAISAPG